MKTIAQTMEMAIPVLNGPCGLNKFYISNPENLKGILVSAVLRT